MEEYPAPMDDWLREYYPERFFLPESPRAVRRRVVRKLLRFIWSLPPSQGYRITEHDPMREDGTMFTVQLVGPPWMR